ncbi:hypothetical protein ACJJTC_017690 [Scirpophaga incertulas]
MAAVPVVCGVLSTAVLFAGPQPSGARTATSCRRAGSAGGASPATSQWESDVTMEFKRRFHMPSDIDALTVGSPGIETSERSPAIETGAVVTITASPHPTNPLTIQHKLRRIIGPVFICTLYREANTAAFSLQRRSTFIYAQVHSACVATRAELRLSALIWDHSTRQYRITQRSGRFVGYLHVNLSFVRAEQTLLEIDNFSEAEAMCSDAILYYLDEELPNVRESGRTWNPAKLARHCATEFINSN